MQTRPQPLSITVLRPPLLALAFIFKIIHKVFFAWWLDPWLQRKSNQALWDDVQLNLYLLYSKGELIKEKRPQILPFDYASFSLGFRNIRLFFYTRTGRTKCLPIAASCSNGYPPAARGYRRCGFERRDRTETDCLPLRSGGSARSSPRCP